MVVKNYFHIQKLSFSLCGINTEAKSPQLIVKRPWLCYVPLFFAIAHVAAIIHYAYVNRNDYVEVTESLALSCQSLLAIWKMLIFLGKRNQFVEMINKIHLHNFKVFSQELSIIASENKRDVKFCTMYFWTVFISGFLAFLSPIVEAFYIFYTTGSLVLRVPYKGSYFLDHSKLPGYTLVYLWNVLSIYNLFGISMAIDTLFTWMVSNITAQFHVLRFRLQEAAKTSSETGGGADKNKIDFNSIKSCIHYHKQTVELSSKLNQAYGEIIFIKFIISCSQICFLVFCLICPIESLVTATYQCSFLLSVCMQLMLYCYNGQRIRDESLQVASEIYFAFGCSNLTESCKKLLFLPMMRSQKSSELRGVFFVLDLNLFLWAFKTAGSLITALKTLNEN